MVWYGWYAGRVAGLPAEALQPLLLTLNLHIFIISFFGEHNSMANLVNIDIHIDTDTLENIDININSGIWQNININNIFHR